MAIHRNAIVSASDLRPCTCIPINVTMPSDEILRVGRERPGGRDLICLTVSRQDDIALHDCLNISDR